MPCRSPHPSRMSLTRVVGFAHLIVAFAVVLMASKTWNGHAEPAAGLVAMLHALQALHHAAALPLLHLRRLNPYVAAALEASDEKDAAAWGRASRQPGADGTMKVSCGVSAFAFQVRPWWALAHARRSCDVSTSKW